MSADTPVVKAKEIIAKFKIPVPESDVYPVACVRDDSGHVVMVVRGMNALFINSPKAKQIACEAQKRIPGYEQQGIEPWGGAYIIDATTGDMIQSPPMIKEGQVMPPHIRYERKFRLNPKL